MLTVACVNQGNYLGRGQEYVDKLRSMVSRNLSQPFKFVCIEEAKDRDGEELTGWWTKIALFQPGRFAGRVLFFDLDTVITGSLDELSATKGIIDLVTWGWRTHTLCSSVMCWDAGEHEGIYNKYHSGIPKDFRGDQDWITHLGGWPILPAEFCASYRYHSRDRVPQKCVAVNFHGKPKPHEVKGGWVPKLWK